MAKKYTITVLVSLLAGVIFAYGCSEEPPIHQIESVKAEMISLERRGAAVFASAPYMEITGLIEEIQYQVEQENYNNIPAMIDSARGLMVFTNTVIDSDGPKFANENINRVISLLDELEQKVLTGSELKLLSSEEKSKYEEFAVEIENKLRLIVSSFENSDYLRAWEDARETAESAAAAIEELDSRMVNGGSAKSISR